MIENSFYQEVMRLLLASPMEESLFQTLQYLEFSSQAGGFALLLRPSDATHATLLGTSQLQNIQGLPVSLPLPKENGMFSVEDIETVQSLAAAMELDILCDNATAYGCMGSLVTHGSDVVLLMFAERGKKTEFSLEILCRLFQLFLRDTFFLSQLRERTNPAAERRENRVLSIIKGNRELFENSTDGILILDHHMHVVFVNHMLENILGYALSSLAGRSVFTLIAPQDAEAFQENILEPDTPFETECITLSMESVILRTERSRMLAEDGLIVLHCWDVTETRRVQKQLSSTSDFLGQLVSNSSVAIVAGEVGGKLFLFSPAAEKLFGYDAGTAIGNLRFPDLFIDAEAWTTIENILQEGNSSHRVDQLSVDVKVAGNMEAPAVLSAFLVPHYQPGRDAIVAYFADLRDKKAMEAAIIEYQKKLEDTEKQAMLSSLAGAMAHELNQPLMSILGYAELLQKPNLPPEKMERGIRTIAREAERMSEIVKKIGNITHFETRNYVGNTTILDLEKGSAPPESK